MSDYIVIWKDAPGQQVATIADAVDQPVLRDEAYVATQGIVILRDEESVLDALRAADGTKYAVTPALAQQTLGWDV
jgi:hypothetical protein